MAILDSEAARGAQGCARVRWVEEGEILSSYFFRLEKWSSDRWISALRESDGSIVSSPADFCRSLSSFYSGLFTASGNLSSFLPGDQAATRRFIGENVALLRDVVDYASFSGALVAILSLDQEKAFDCVEWSFMRSTLCTMGFGPSLISLVDLFYHQVQSAVNVNGYLSFFFGLSRPFEPLWPRVKFPSG